MFLIRVDEYYGSAETFKTQDYINSIAEWTKQNLMELKEKKINYMVISRSETEIAT